MKIIGANKRSYPSQTRDGRVDITVVLVEGTIGDYSAYCGSGDEEFVARHGNKLSFNEAQAHFYNSLEREKYRS